MTSQLIASASADPVTLAEAKAHLRVSSDDENELIADLIAAATQTLELETGIAMLTQSWRLWIDAIPSDKIVRLPRHPVQSIAQVVWYDSEGNAEVLDSGAYFLNAMTRPARLRFDVESCPTGTCNGVEVDFVAGYGDSGTDTPDILRRAILLLVAHWYEFRGVYTADDQPVSVPETYTRLIRHYRLVRL